MGIVDFSSVEGAQLLKNLYAYSWALFKRLYRAEVNERGKSFKDYVHDALEKHFRGLDNYDSLKSPLEYHLKFHIIKHAQFEDLPSHVKKGYKEKRLKEDVNKLEMTHLTPQIKDIAEAIASEASIFSEDEQNQLLIEIEKAVKNDDVVERIYLAVVHDNFKLSDRSEICKAFEISPKDFDNGRRRFATILNKHMKSITNQ